MVLVHHYICGNFHLKNGKLVWYSKFVSKELGYMELGYLEVRHIEVGYMEIAYIWKYHNESKIIEVR